MFKPSSLTTTCLMLLSLTWLIFAASRLSLCLGQKPSSLIGKGLMDLLYSFTLSHQKV